MPNFFINVKSKGAKKASGEIKGLTGNLNGMASAAKKAAVVFGVGFLGKQIFDVGKGAIATAASFETLKVRLTALYGSVERGTKAFDNFNKVAATTPFQLQDVVDAGASLKAFGLDAEEMIKPLADLAAFMQVDMSVAASNMGRAFVAGAGAADMFREKGINQMIADMAGVMDATKLPIEQYRETLQKVLLDPNSGIAGMTSKMADTWSGAVSNFQDGIDRLQAAIGDELIGVLRPKLDAVNVELSKMANIGWENIGQTFIENSGIFIDMGTGVMGAGGKIMGLTLADAIGDGIEALLPTKLEAIAAALAPLLGFWGDQVVEDMFGGIAALKESAIAFDEHDAEIQALFASMQILMTEGYAEFIRLAEEQKIATEGSTEAIVAETDALDKNKKGVEDNIGAFKKFNKWKDDMAKKDTFRIAMQSKDAESGMKAVVKAEAMEAIAGLISSILKTVPYPVNLILAAGAGGVANAAIERSLGAVKFAKGADFVTSGPQMMMVGDNPGGQERVSVTPLSSPNLEGPQGGSSNITLNISAPLVDDTVVDSIIPAIREAIRRGEDIGIS